MIAIKNEQAIALMTEAGALLAGVFADLAGVIRPGMSTLELDAWIAQALQKRSLVSQSLGYHGYKHVSCISINDVVVHGVPHDRVVLCEGDLVKVDVCAAYKGYCADMARCFFVGQMVPSSDARALVEVAQRSLDAGIAKARVGGRLTDISAAIQEEVERHGYGVVRIFAGHGIGRRMHEDPELLNYGKPGKGPVLRHGMALAIEPMITLGHYDVVIDSDKWTARTADGKLAAHVEDTVIITHDGPRITTRL